MNKDLILKGLNDVFPEAKTELFYNKDYELVISTVLSAQTTDKRVNLVMEPIYKEYDSLEKLNKLSLEEIEKLISSIGLYKTKAKYFKAIVEELIKYDKVPNDRKILESISGVGRKSTNLILSVLYNEPFIAVDTHVTRISKRLGIANEVDDVLKIEEKLYSYFGDSVSNKLAQQLVLFGRYICESKKPKCNECPFNKECTSKDKLI